MTATVKQAPIVWCVSKGCYNYGRWEVYDDEECVGVYCLTHARKEMARLNREGGPGRGVRV